MPRRREEKKKVTPKGRVKKSLSQRLLRERKTGIALGLRKRKGRRAALLALGQS